jgi:hypothetical protein
MNLFLATAVCAALLPAAPVPIPRPDSLPADPDKVIEKVEQQVREIQKRAEAAVQARRKKLLERLNALHKAALKKGKADEAAGIRDRIVLVEALWASPVPLAAAPGKALATASANGKYKQLLRAIAVPADRQGYHDFTDFGRWNGREYAGHAHLPEGYWVYSYPFWFIWKDGP